MKVHLCILLANGFPVPAPFFESFVLLQHYLLQGVGNKGQAPDLQVEGIRVTFEKNFPVDWARNHAVAAFLDHDDADYLLFLDADMAHPPDMVHRLVRHRKDVVTARYVMRKPPFFTVGMRKVGALAHEYQALEKLGVEMKGLVPIDAGGAGALLISRRVLQDIRARIGDDWFRYQDGPEGLRCRSEDMWFYEQARMAGHQAWLDADLIADHVASFPVNPSYHEPYAERYRKATEEVTA